MSYDVAKQITDLRREIIINRIICFVYGHSAYYDNNGLALIRLCEDYPDIATSTPYYSICPTIVAPSFNVEDYPPELVKEAETHLHDGN